MRFHLMMNESFGTPSICMESKEHFFITIGPFVGSYANIPCLSEFTEATFGGETRDNGPRENL